MIHITLWLFVTFLVLFNLALFSLPTPSQRDARNTSQGSLLNRDDLPISTNREGFPVSVMIDNFASARTQHSGIRSASIVYEALTEGGITRLMLVFPYQDTDRVGPVRSARDYFVDFAEEYGGIYVHAGGSPTSLEKLFSSTRLYSLEEDDRLESQTYSFRDPNFPAPHNLFADLFLVRERAKEMGFQRIEPLQSFCFLNAKLPTTNYKLPTTTLSLDFSNDPSSSYFVQFVYNAETKTYQRFYGQKSPTPHLDQRGGEQVAPDTVIVQISPSFLIDGDEKERLALHDIGEGAAFIFRNNEKITGRWEKKSRQEATRFLDAEGNPICFEPGQIWVAIVDSEALIVDS